MPQSPIGWSRRALLKAGLAVTTVANAPVVALAVPSDSAEPDTSAASPRERLLLDFNWRFQLGHASDPSKDFNFGKLANEATFAKSGRVGSVTTVRFDDSAWRAIDLPHDWAVDLPFQNSPPVIVEHGAKPLGREFPETSIGWYRRIVALPASDAGKRISIEFDGVFRNATVFFNGFYLGTNFSGYAPFSFDVTDFANPGDKNVLTVRVDASFSESWYYEGAGIYRHVWLVKTAPVHISQWSHCVRAEVKPDAAAISVLAEVHNQSDRNETCRLFTSIFDPAGKPAATANSEPVQIAAFGKHNFSAIANIAHPLLWSCEPGQEKHLYRAVTRIQTAATVVDSEETTFGVRTLGWDADLGFFLNGKPVKIKGTCNHQDNAGLALRCRTAYTGIGSQRCRKWDRTLTALPTIRLRRNSWTPATVRVCW